MWLIGFFGVDLGRHEGFSAFEAASRISRLVWRGKPPVDDLQVEVSIEADILRLQIPMAKAVVLHPLDSLEELTRHVANITLFKSGMLHIEKEIVHRRVLLNSVDHWYDIAIALSVRAVLADAIKADDVYMGRTGL